MFSFFPVHKLEGNHEEYFHNMLKLTYEGNVKNVTNIVTDFVCEYTINVKKSIKY